MYNGTVRIRCFFYLPNGSKLLRKQTLASNIMGNAGRDDDDDDMSPEALVMESVASMAIDIEKKHDVEKDAAASIPPELSRAAARNITSQPGAFRSTGSTSVPVLLDDTENDDEDYSYNSSSGVAPYSSPRDDRTTVVEATLVTETPPVTPFTSEQREAEAPPVNGIPIYKAEPIEQPKEDANIVAINRKWIWWIALAVSILIAVTVVAVIVAVSNTKQSDNATENTSNTNSTPKTADSDWKHDEQSVTAALSPYDRITHHIALFHFLSPGSCSPLRDRNNLRADAVSITVTCGNRQGQPRELQPQEDAALIVYDMNHCEQSDQDVVQCLVKQDRQDILFTCGTHRSFYNSSGTSFAVTATVQVENTVSTCSRFDESNYDPVYNTNQNSNVSIVAALVGTGRMCRQPENANNWTFRPTNNVCHPDDSNKVVAGGNLATYCTQNVPSCDTPNCLVYLNGFTTLDANDDAASDCQAQNLHDSILYEELIGGNPDAIEKEISLLIQQQDNFITGWLNQQSGPSSTNSTTNTTNNATAATTTTTTNGTLQQQQSRANQTQKRRFMLRQNPQ